MATAELVPLPDESVHSFSRFFKQPIYLVSNIKFWGTYQFPEIPVSPFDTYHIVAELDVYRLDLIAYKYYSTPELWWIIALVNQIFFEFDEMEVGQVLRIPDKGTLTTLGLIR